MEIINGKFVRSMADSNCCRPGAAVQRRVGGGRPTAAEVSPVFLILGTADSEGAGGSEVYAVLPFDTSSQGAENAHSLQASRIGTLPDGKERVLYLGVLSNTNEWTLVPLSVHTDKPIGWIQICASGLIEVLALWTDGQSGLVLTGDRESAREQGAAFPADAPFQSVAERKDFVYWGTADDRMRLNQ